MKQTLCLAGAICLTGMAHAAEPFAVLPASATHLLIDRAGKPRTTIELGGWGPNWSWMNWTGEVIHQDGDALISLSSRVPKTESELSLTARVKRTAERQLQIDLDVAASKDTALTMVKLGLTPDRACFETGRVKVTRANGETDTTPLPLARGDFGDSVKTLSLTDKDGHETVYSLDPPLPVSYDGELRVAIAGDHLSAATPARARVTIDFPEPVTLHADISRIPQQEDLDAWYPFVTSADHDSPSAFDMQDWLEKPAGAHGRIRRQEDQLIYNDAPIKLWGLNLTYAACAPEKELADRHARFYAKYGINAVRLHKFADGHGWAGIQSADHFDRFDPAALDRMDYLVAQLKARGIYVKLSPTFIIKLGQGDREAVPFLDEFGEPPNRRPGWRVSTRHGSVFLSRELQDLQIRQTVRLLQHTNPYTGLTYAEDPAVAIVEMFNEDDALFGGIMHHLSHAPTLRRYAGELFTEWLETLYGSEEALRESWGPDALNSFTYENLIGESWDERTILPIGNPWFFDPAQLDGSQHFRKQRLLDTMRFLYAIQNRFYSRFESAIRDAGYHGELIASNWQAGVGAAHYWNLHSDYRFGMIDRHNYFSGGKPLFNNASMLSEPGSAILSTGMQQVRDRPFMLSEWITCNPNEWGVEGPALIGAYGMGLQGWDVSFVFQNKDRGRMSDRFTNTWQVDKPTILGLFPAVARQVLRNDVRESTLVIPRTVHPASLVKGHLGFRDQTMHQGDVKTFTSDKVSHRALAVGRCVVEFVHSPRDTSAFDMQPHHAEGVYTASTGELQWHEGASPTDGYFTIDSAGTKAVVGFSKDAQCALGSIKIAPKSRFSAIYLSALERDQTIATADRLLITAIARVRQQGMVIYGERYLLEEGGPPFLMEPVRAELRLPADRAATVYLLDHNGRRQDQAVPTDEGRITIDTGRDRTPYYEVVFP